MEGAEVGGAAAKVGCLRGKFQSVRCMQERVSSTNAVLTNCAAGSVPCDCEPDVSAMTTMLISQGQGGYQRAANEGTAPQMLLMAKNRRDGGCGCGQQVEMQLDRVPRYLRGAKEKLKSCRGRRGVGGSKKALSREVLKSVERWYRRGSVEDS